MSDSDLCDGLYLNTVDPGSGATRSRRVLPTPSQDAGPALRDVDPTPHAREDDLMLFAFRALERRDPERGTDTPGNVDLMLVVDGRPMSATLDGEQAVALGVALLMAHRKEAEAWVREQVESAPLPEAS